MLPGSRELVESLRLVEERLGAADLQAAERRRLRRRREELRRMVDMYEMKPPAKPRGAARCKTCRGRGRIVGVHTRTGAGAQGGSHAVCPDCGGSGSAEDQASG